jgi:diguanylate cyclase (GGDEF)-like protein
VLKRWALFSTSVRVVALVLFIDATAVIFSVAALWHGPITASDLLRFGLLAVLSVVYLEASRQVELRRRLLVPGDSSHVDVSSVWTVAGAMVLPIGLAASLAGLIYLHAWLRSWRHVDGAQSYRGIYSAAAVVLTCIGVSATLHLNDMRLTGLGAVSAVVTAIALFMVLDRGLVGLALAVSGHVTKPTALLGSLADNAFEFATLVLGAVTAASVLYGPWFAVMVLPAVFLLQYRALIKQLVAAATIDTKTELLNASAWRVLAQRELERAQREGTPTTVLVIDMDRFKLVNDMYGHLAGDTALKAVAESLTDELRGYDAVGRFGGEEFVALLPGVGPRMAANVGERIRQRIASLAVSVEPRTGGTTQVRLTASIGVASGNAHASTLDDLLRAADGALYAAKGDGRNAVRVAPVALARAS